MENFNIEELERKNIYKTPENFFDKVQNSVLNEIQLQPKQESKPAKIFKLNWTYAVAASLVLLFGMLAFFQMDQETSTVKQTTANVEVPNKVEKHEALKAYQTLQQDIATVDMEKSSKQLVSTDGVDRKKIEQVKTVETTKPKTNTNNTKAQMEQVMSELSNKEIADLGKGAEQDIYLDLYN